MGQKLQKIPHCDYILQYFLKKQVTFRVTSYLSPNIFYLKGKSVFSFFCRRQNFKKIPPRLYSTIFSKKTGYLQSYIGVFSEYFLSEGENRVFLFEVWGIFLQNAPARLYDIIFLCARGNPKGDFSREALAREGRGKTLCFIIEKDAMVWYNIEKR